MKYQVAFVHTSPAAIPPLADYYHRNAPDLEVTNLLDDGILRLFSREAMQAAQMRLEDLLVAARDAYHSRLALLTCSAVSRAMVKRLSRSLRLPLVKIDDVLARKAVAAGSRLGVFVTFPPTQAATTKLLRETAAEQGRSLELTFRVVPEAYEALLGGDPDRHDELALAAIQEMSALPLDAIVLAQVSMARLLPRLPPTPMPVLSSLPASLEAVREELGRLSSKTR
jgi:hypothetical protein